MALFERAEFLHRIARTKAEMRRRGLDVLLISSPANQFYLTGYDGWSFYTPQMVIVTLDREEPIWFGRKMDAVGAKFTAFLSPESVIPYADIYVGSADLHPMTALVELLQEHKLDKASIGVEMDDYYYTARWHQILTEGLPGAGFSDAFLLVNRVRMTKSAREIEFMMQAGKIAGAAMEAARQKADIGVRQSDVMGEVYRVTTAGTEEFGGTFPCKPPNAMVGELCSAPHLSWTDEPLREDEIFYIELGGIRHRYHSPLSRCIYVGKPPAELVKTTAVIREGLEAVLDIVKPGVLCEELAAEWKKVISRHGIEKDSRIGYPVGIGYPPTWGELTCSLRAGDKTVMEENMTFHCIPALWFEKYGLVVSESFVVTSEGAKTFADYPRTLLTPDKFSAASAA
ncbi:M24 family metallopeptidase [Aureimonas fodinaquatilis]|uniref:M24 family metallopeptidase n=1 Tax=Aureimonas fodinaquatilis TaxID=2565783 RepID=A0A5B0DQF5_9HYPH|nr:Xaa-Pro peptidase family protein [Aureimonas fodinaquatilis]KAA0969037.1 M24 family metallopeptidase [Aureimonas fodinaquatilis]